MCLLGTIVILWSYFMFYRRLSWLEKKVDISYRHNLIPTALWVVIAFTGSLLGLISTILTGAEERVVIVDIIGADAATRALLLGGAI